MQPTKTRAQIFADMANPPEQKWRKDPVSWARERAGVDLWSKQQEIMISVRDNAKTAVASCHQIGKAAPLDTPLATPEGWTTMGDIKIGDQVLDENGKPCRVAGLSPVWNLPCYRVMFSDGTEQIVNGAHEWSALDMSHRRRKVIDWRDHWSDTVTVDTDYMRVSLLTDSGQRRWRVPLCRALDLPNASLPIDPYVLGVWLGDGTSVRAEITCHPDEIQIIEEIRSTGERVRKRESAQYAWIMTGELPDRPRLHSRLRGLGVLSNKHIPITYLRASRAQRLRLLQGLMDTDGFNGSAVGIDLCDERLADDVAHLVRTLGWQVRVRKGVTSIGGTRYRLSFRADVCPFLLRRKVTAWKAPNSSAPTLRAIVSVESVGNVPTRCIEVDSPRHLYLIGRNMVPTHNSFTAAMTVAWWLDTHLPGEAFVVTTAPTAPQVKAILWREINRVHEKASLRGRTNLTEWYIGDELVAFGRKPSDYNDQAFSGIHARYVLVVLDEACGIPKQLWDASSTLGANPETCRVLAIGNPDDPSGEFASVCAPNSGWHTMHIGYADTPNFTGEPVSQLVKDSLIHPLWVEDRRDYWGEESALFQSKCQGIFPVVGNPWQVIPHTWANACRYKEFPSGKTPIEAGIDVGAGNDRTVVVVREGARVKNVKWFVNPDPVKTVAMLAMHLKEHGVTCAKVDTIGVGWGIYGSLFDLSTRNNPQGAYTTHDADVIPINVAQSPTPGEEHRFVNRRAQMWWDVGRENCRLGLWDLSGIEGKILDDVIHELTMPMYEIMDAKGKIKIEAKDEIIKRLRGASPDLAEALLLAFVPVNWSASIESARALDVAPSFFREFSALDSLGPRSW